MYESTLITELVRPVLADVLLGMDVDRREPGRLLADAQNASLSTLDGTDLTVEEAATRLCRCAGLLLAIAQPHAPVAPQDQQADLLTYTLRVLCIAHRVPGDLGAQAREQAGNITSGLCSVERRLAQLHANPVSSAASAALLEACMSTAEACVRMLDSVLQVGEEAGSAGSAPDTSGWIERDRLRLSSAAEDVCELFARLSRADQLRVVDEAGENAAARDGYGPASAWTTNRQLADFLTAFASLGPDDRDSALRGCAWHVVDQETAIEDAAGYAREGRPPHSAELIAGFGTWERAVQAADLNPEPDPAKDETPDPYRGTCRNEPCPCGSGRKFKRCHGRSE